MIRYALICDNAHEFESWFSSSASFEDQTKRGFVTCPACNSAKIERAIMAPNVARTDLDARATGPAPEAPSRTLCTPATCRPGRRTLGRGRALLAVWLEPPSEPATRSK